MEKEEKKKMMMLITTAITFSYSLYFGNCSTTRHTLLLCFRLLHEFMQHRLLASQNK